MQHHRELQFIDSKNLALLKDQAECAAVQADFVYTDLTQSNSQVLLSLQSRQVITSAEEEIKALLPCRGSKSCSVRLSASLVSSQLLILTSTAGSKKQQCSA